MTKPTPHHLSDYKHSLIIQTRWNDNDIYGHINNAVYYFYFDTVVNSFLIKNQLLKLGQSQIIGLVVDTGCTYFAPMQFPDEITAGLRVAKLGKSSVRYEIALFRNDEAHASAQGHFMHVYVDEATRKPVPIPNKMRNVLNTISQ